MFGATQQIGRHAGPEGGAASDFRQHSQSEADRARTIADLKGMITAKLAEYTAGMEQFALLDAPDYPNVGDSAIYLGTQDFSNPYSAVGRHMSARTPLVIGRRSIGWTRRLRSSCREAVISETCGRGSRISGRLSSRDIRGGW
jgi:hypothetical protein